MTSKIKDISIVKPTKKGFDFEYWRDLAKKDPEAFEAAREQEINQYISGLANEDVQDRMRRLQWRVEMERKRSKSPMDSAVRIYDMMWESVGKNFEAIQDLAEHFKPEDQRTSSKTSKAKVLEFKQDEEVTGTAG